MLHKSSKRTKNPSKHQTATFSNNIIKLWNLETGEEIDTLKGHSDYIRSVAISPDGKTLVSGSDDNTIKIWRLE